MNVGVILIKKFIYHKNKFKLYKEKKQMKNRKGDFLWASVLLIWILILIVPATRTTFIEVTEAHPYMGGFFKFFILASMGDWLGFRILKGEWIIPKGFILKAVVWGILGMMITLVFTVFTAGAAAAQAAGKLPLAGSKLAQAFFGSTIMNFIGKCEGVNLWQYNF